MTEKQSNFGPEFTTTKNSTKSINYTSKLTKLASMDIKDLLTSQLLAQIRSQALQKSLKNSLNNSFFFFLKTLYTHSSLPHTHTHTQ